MNITGYLPQFGYLLDVSPQCCALLLSPFPRSCSVPVRLVLCISSSVVTVLQSRVAARGGVLSRCGGCHLEVISDLNVTRCRNDREVGWGVYLRCGH